MISAASVPRRGEYMNVNPSTKPTSSDISSVGAKSSSVSPGKPTMMSVVIAGSGTRSRISATRRGSARGRSGGAYAEHAGGPGLYRQVHVLEPDWSSPCARMTSSVMCAGCGLVYRIAAIPSIASTACSSSENFRRCGPQLQAVGVDVLAEQRHLAHALGGQQAHLVHEFLERPRDLAAARRRHDAVRALHVAAGADLHPGREGPARACAADAR